MQQGEIWFASAIRTRPAASGPSSWPAQGEIWFASAIRTLPRESFRRPITKLTPVRLEEACQTLKAVTGC